VNSNQAAIADGLSDAQSLTSDLGGEGLGRYSLKCEICGQWFKSRKDFRTHTMLHNRGPQQWRSLCSKCHMWFESETLYFSHKCLTEAHRTCTHCNLRFSSEMELLLHYDIRDRRNGTCPKEVDLITEPEIEEYPSVLFRNDSQGQNLRKFRSRYQRLLKRAQVVEDDRTKLYNEDSPADSVEIWPCVHCVKVFDSQDDYKSHVDECKRRAELREEQREEAEKAAEEERAAVKYRCTRCPHDEKRYDNLKDLAAHQAKMHRAEIAEERERSLNEKRYLEEAQLRIAIQEERRAEEQFPGLYT